MKATYDKTIDALYLYITNEKVFKSVPISERLIVDLDKKGNLIGVEMLEASQQLDFKKTKKTTLVLPALTELI